jgi:hypothetical protein
MDKQEKKYLIIGGLIIGGYLLYRWYTNSQATAAAATAQATTPATTTTTPISQVVSATEPAAAPVVAETSTAETPAAPTYSDPSVPGAVTFEIVAVDADNQQGAYNCTFLLSITNNMDVPIQLENITGTATYMGYPPEAFATDTQPNPYNGLLGPVTDASQVSIAPGITASKWYKVNVSVNSATNYYLGILAYQLASDTLKNNKAYPFNFAGSAQMNGVTVTINTTYIA